MAASAPCVRPRARELLTKLTPAILKALAGDRRSRYRLCAVRPLSFQPAVRRAAFLAVPGAAGISGSAGAGGWFDAASCHSSGAHARNPGCAAGRRFPGAPAAAAVLDANLAAPAAAGSYEEQLDGARRFAREENFPRRRAIGGWRGHSRAGRSGLRPHCRNRDRRPAARVEAELAPGRAAFRARISP